MTDEEKASEYVEKNIDIAISMYNPNATGLVGQAYLDGLAEGRKELEKENEELKADKKYLDNINNEQTEIILQLNEQIEQLSNDNRVLRTALFTQKIQIEKMKCCGNCKHLCIYFDEETETTHCCIYQNECHNYDKWELAE